jgi:hypothetical protein
VTIAKRPSYRAGMARIPKDDLPDAESEIFLERGLGGSRTEEARNEQVICPSGTDLICLSRVTIRATLITDEERDA